MPLIRVTTNQGIEDIAEAESRRLLDLAGVRILESERRPWGLAGVVTLEVAGDEDRDSDLVARIGDALSCARSLYHVVVHTGSVEWTGQPLEELAAQLAALPLGLMERASGFRASCSRVGEHPFQSPDVEAALGAALQERFGTPVDLEGFDLNIRVDIVHSHCLCGYQLTGRKGLDRRYRWVYHPRVTLRTTVAHAMLDIAGFRDRPGNLLDPFCGSGTILMEAAALVPPAGDRPDTIRIHGSDWLKAAVAGCRDNLQAQNLDARITVEHGDARELAAVHQAGSFEYIVTNPPFGVRLGRDSDLVSLYRKFLGQASVVLREGGVLALLVGKRRGGFNRLIQASDDFRIEHVRIIEIGGVYPGLFVLRRCGGGS